jgi:succinate dehydrogenase / fumarate reductase cytochrome b subunit
VARVEHRSTRGRRAFSAHRWTGLLVLAYLYLHLAVLSTVLLPGGRAAFDRTLAVLQSPPFVVADLALFGVIFFHALNGIRVVLAEFGLLIRRNALALWATLAVGALILLLASVALAPEAFG